MTKRVVLMAKNGIIQPFRLQRVKTNIPWAPNYENENVIDMEDKVPKNKPSQKMIR